VGLDFVPLGKTLKIFIGPVNSIIHNKVKDFIVKLLRKQGKKVGKILQGSKLFGKVVKKATVRIGKHGKAIEIFFHDGSKKDINPVRVKEWIPNPHPKAPPGTLQKVEFKDFLPGSKGYKRAPTQEELEILRKF